MNRLKPLTPATLLALSLLAAFVLMVNYQWLYGGYEGLLYNSLEPYLRSQEGHISGQFTITPEVDDTLESIMNITFDLQGDYDMADEKASIEITLTMPDGSGKKQMGSLEWNGQTLVLYPESGETPMDLSGLMAEKKVTSSDEDQWENFYNKLTVYETDYQDPGHGYLEKEVVCYELSLMNMMDESVQNELSGMLGERDSNDIEGLLKIMVDKEGNLSSFNVAGIFGNLSVDGWCVLE